MERHRHNLALNRAGVRRAAGTCRVLTSLDGVPNTDDRNTQEGEDPEAAALRLRLETNLSTMRRSIARMTNRDADRERAFFKVIDAAADDVVRYNRAQRLLNADAQPRYEPEALKPRKKRKRKQDQDNSTAPDDASAVKKRKEERDDGDGGAGGGDGGAGGGDGAGGVGGASSVTV